MKRYLATLLVLAVGIPAVHAQSLGTAWHLINSGLGASLSSMRWTANDTGYFLADQSTLSLTRTTDGGTNFTVQSFPDSQVLINGVKSRYLEFTLLAGGMSWPTTSTGYIPGETTSDTFGHAARATVLKTTDGGATFREYYLTDPLAKFSQYLDFPKEKVGFASAQYNDSMVMEMTTDSAKDWTVVYHSPNLNLYNMSFLDAKNGIVYALDANSGTNHILYTTDGWATSHVVSAPEGSLVNYIKWDADTSWMIAIDSTIYRSTDSGTKWVPVLPADTFQSIVTVAFHDSVGFAFRSNTEADTLKVPVFHMTKDYGKTWITDTLPRFGVDYITPISASMPNDSVVDLMGSTAGGSKILERLTLHTSSGGGQGIVSIAPVSSSSFTAAVNGNSILFSASAGVAPRTIEVMDVLGRICATVSLAPGANSGELSANQLTPGSYFARLGDQMVKFSISN